MIQYNKFINYQFIILLSGVMNVSACRFGAPVFISFPHFYAADPYYLQFVDGLKPNKSKHEFHITMEPDTAIPLEVAARLQVNVMVRQSPNIALFQEAPTLFFPVLWFEQKVRIPDELIDGITIAASMPIIGYTCIGILIAIGFIILILISCQKMRESNLKNVLHKEEFGLANGKLNKNHTGAEQPLMSEKKLLAHLDVNHISELQSVPLAIPDAGNEQKSFTKHH